MVTMQSCGSARRGMRSSRPELNREPGLHAGIAYTLPSPVLNVVGLVEAVFSIVTAFVADGNPGIIAWLAWLKPLEQESCDKSLAEL